MTEPPNGLPRYRLLTGPDDEAFCRRVSEALDLGYELYGDPAIKKLLRRLLAFNKNLFDGLAGRICWRARVCSHADCSIACAGRTTNLSLEVRGEISVLWHIWARHSGSL